MLGSGLLGGRYRLEEPPIGHGGMGVVYRAVDTGVRNRGVAVKTIRGPVDGASVEQFRKEWDALADLCHANIIDVYDVGEFSDQEGRKPYFVMPLLRGSNLGDLLQNADSRPDPERIVGIICQACKGLQSAHNRGVIHRDLKPSNIFVLDDDSVKIIDFGIAHLASNESGTALKGTLHYMAPEQLDGKVTAQSDIFSLGVVCYEALAGRKPFEGDTPPQVMDAIRLQIPPSLSELNASVPFPLAQVIHRALAKQVYHRVTSAREFSDLLQRALKGESIPQFDRTRLTPRLGRIRKALSDGDLQYAKELLRDLQAEGHIDHEISLLRLQMEEMTRARSVHQFLDTARLRMDEEDYPLALEKVQSVLDLEADNIDALALRREIELKRSTAGIEKWYQIACQYRDNKLFAKAREAVAEISKIDPGHRRAVELLSEIKRGEQEQSQLRQEKQNLYESALKAYGSGEISTALSKLERIIELGKRASGQPQGDSEYERLYNQIRLERDELQASYAEARTALESRDLKRAREICKQVLDRRPRDPLFKALQIEVDESGRQLHSAEIAEWHSRIEAEKNLETKFQLVNKAVNLFPEEQTFAESLRLVKEKRDLVNTIAGRAREYESQSQFPEARNQWDILRTIYPQYPSLDHELGRLGRKQQDFLQKRAKSDCLQQISRALAAGDYEIARRLLSEAFSDFPDDPELIRLNEEFERALEAGTRSRELLEAGLRLAAAGNRIEAVGSLRAAWELDGNSTTIRAALRSALLEHAQSLPPGGWRAALPLCREALELDRTDPAAVKLCQQLEETARQEQGDWLPEDLRRLQEENGQSEALDKIDEQLDLKVPQNFGKTKDTEELDETTWRFPRQVQNSGDIFVATELLAEKQDRHNVEHADSPEAGEPLPPADSRPEHDLAGHWESQILEKTSETRKPPGVGTIAVMALTLAMLVFAGLLIHSRRTADSSRRQEASGVVTAVKPEAPPASPAVPLPATGRSDVPEIPPASAAGVSSPARRRLIPVSIRSSPEPAEVKADHNGSLRCWTPCTLNLSPGEHTLALSADNRDPVYRVITLPGAEDVFAEMPQASGTVEVISNPARLKIWIDGQEKGETPIKLRLTTGQHKLRVTGNGSMRDQTIDVLNEEQGLQIVTIDLAVPKAAPEPKQPESSQAPPGVAR